MINLKDLAVEELKKLVKNMGEPEYRAEQILYWLYSKGASSFDEMTNLSLSMREELKKYADISLPSIEEEKESSDSTKKYLIRLKDGSSIESVLLKDRARITLCLSTQAGCRFGCTYCLTGRGGFNRDLKPSEIVDQIILIKKADILSKKKPVNIVFMGMGEPLDNYGNLVKAVDSIISKKGMSIPQRRITLSTAGIIENIISFTKRYKNINISLSINASRDDTRSAIMPVNRRYPMKQLIKTVKERVSLSGRKNITIEYVMIDSINDSSEDAHELARLIKGLRCKVNLIPLNSGAGDEFNASPMHKVLAFQKILIEKRFKTFIRKGKGADIMAACGQLST